MKTFFELNGSSDKRQMETLRRYCRRVLDKNMKPTLGHILQRRYLILDSKLNIFIGEKTKNLLQKSKVCLAFKFRTTDDKTLFKWVKPLRNAYWKLERHNF